jgi:hypothetical protein
MFEVRGVKGLWSGAEAPPEVGGTLQVVPFGEVTVKEYRLSSAGELRAIVSASDSSMQEMLDTQEGIGGSDIDYSSYKPEKLWKLRVFHTPKGSPYGPNGQSVPEGCVRELGGYGNFSVDQALCVPYCPHAVPCHARVTGMDPNIVIDAPRRQVKAKKAKKSKSKGWSNPYEVGTVRHAMVELLVETSKLNTDRDELALDKGAPEKYLVEKGIKFTDAREECWKALAGMISLETNGDKKKFRDKAVKKMWGATSWQRVGERGSLDPGIWTIRPKLIINAIS